MIYIITGGIDEGKTQKIAAIYKEMKKGEGWLSGKIFLDQDFIGYEIVRLSTNEKMPLAYKIENVPLGWDEIYRLGPFSFSKKAFDFAERIIAEIIAQDIEPVFIDEIGPLELKGKGFCSLLQKILKTQKDIYIVVRTHCVDEVIKKFKIKEYEKIALSVPSG